MTQTSRQERLFSPAKKASRPRSPGASKTVVFARLSRIFSVVLGERPFNRGLVEPGDLNPQFPRDQRASSH